VAEISEECNMLGFVLFKVLKHEGSFVEVHIQYVLIDAKLAPAGLGTAVVATLFQKVGQALPRMQYQIHSGCENHR